MTTMCALQRAACTEKDCNPPADEFEWQKRRAPHHRFVKGRTALFSGFQLFTAFPDYSDRTGALAMIT